MPTIEDYYKKRQQSAKVKLEEKAHPGWWRRLADKFKKKEAKT